MTRVDAKSAKMFVKNIGVVSMGKLAHTHPKAGVEYELNTTRRSRVVFGLARGKFGSKNNETRPNTTRRSRVVFGLVELFLLAKTAR